MLFQAEASSAHRRLTLQSARRNPPPQHRQQQAGAKISNFRLLKYLTVGTKISAVYIAFQALRQRAKRHLEEQELIKTCNGNTFRPKINAASRLLDKTARPLHERVGQLQARVLKASCTSSLRPHAQVAQGLIQYCTSELASSRHASLRHHTLSIH